MADVADVRERPTRQQEQQQQALAAATTGEQQQQGEAVAAPAPAADSPTTSGGEGCAPAFEPRAPYFSPAPPAVFVPGAAAYASSDRGCYTEQWQLDPQQQQLWCQAAAYVPAAPAGYYPAAAPPVAITHVVVHDLHPHLLPHGGWAWGPVGWGVPTGAVLY